MHENSKFILFYFKFIEETLNNILYKVIQTNVSIHLIFIFSQLDAKVLDYQAVGLYIVMMTKEESTKIVNFMTPGAGVLVLGCGHILYILACKLFFLGVKNHVKVRVPPYR